MKYKLLVAAFPVAMALASPSANASLYLYSGVGCGATAAAQSCLERSQYGVHNTCSVAVDVECPVDVVFPGTATTGTATSITLQAYDRNAAANADVSCNLERIDANGNPTFTMNIKTSGGGAGAGLQSPLVNLGSPLLIGAAWRLRCTLPGASGGWFSHVVSYKLNTNQ